jgi:hypothetical protein
VNGPGGVAGPVSFLERCRRSPSVVLEERQRGSKLLTTEMEVSGDVFKE